MIGIRSLGSRGQLVSDLGPTAQECRRYSLSLSISTLICSIQSQENLEQELAIARNFGPMSAAECEALTDSVYEEAGDGRFEWFKTMQTYDSPYHREQHGFQETGSRCKRCISSPDRSADSEVGNLCPLQIP